MGHGHFGAKLHRSRNGGETWEEIAAPRWPEKPADADDRNPMSGAPWPWSPDQIWILEPDPRGLKALWCGTIPGGLFHSPDGGASWRLVRSLWDRPERKQWMGGGYDFPGIHSISVDPRDPRRVLAGVSTGGAWLTESRPSGPGCPNGTPIISSTATGWRWRPTAGRWRWAPPRARSGCLATPAIRGRA
ncbi:MAG: hypothetical protein E6J63_11830 [Deltaproteobacteria bacterium]|nr:MAG: hypothetical protein E6J63_11830 [Deltaproteobacteria bacterium]